MCHVQNEEIWNNVITMSILDAVVDKLLRKGEKNYKRFLDALSRLYPDLYKVITEGPDDLDPPIPRELLLYRNCEYHTPRDSPDTPDNADIYEFHLKILHL